MIMSPDEPQTEPKTLSDRLSVLHGIALAPEDLIFVLAPLMQQVAALHRVGRVANLRPSQILELPDGRLHLAQPNGNQPRYNTSELDRIQPKSRSALTIAGEYRVTADAEDGIRIDNLLVVEDMPETISRPFFLTTYRCWDTEIGHHDELSDVLALGQIMASLACGLDFSLLADIQSFAAHRTNLFRVNAQLHPAIAKLIVEMTMLDRRERATDVGSLTQRLEQYREQPIGLEVEQALVGVQGTPARRVAVLKHLRDRLFDLSRRNKLIHFRSNQSTANLTVASLPMVMRLDAVRPEQLCVWGGAFTKEIISGSPLALGKWLRFEEQPYLVPAFDKIIQETRRDRAEYGFSNLRLVVAFLHWNNLKEAPDEKIVSPLLWLPVELAKKKGVRDQYTLQAASAEAEINPALRHFLKQLYDINLPEAVNLETVSIESLYRDISMQIARSEPAVRLSLETKPEVRLIHQKAIQRLRAFRQRQGRHLRTHALGRPDFSYERDDYRPLGRALFVNHVQSTPLPQRLATGGSVGVRVETIAPQKGDGDSLTYSVGRAEGHRYDWRIDLTEVTLANFNYKKMALVRDYTQLIDASKDLRAFDRIFSIDPKEIVSDKPTPLPLHRQWDVIPADASQRAAIAYARSGRSFIIQGPPGTGKSQTITNLIADYVGEGKRVLFVCEKRAALDVVFHRLKQANLGQMCCIIHDTQEDKKAFVLDLKEGYEAWTRLASPLAEAQLERQAIVEAHEKQQCRTSPQKLVLACVV
jgi:Protein of unknown function (DUF4011)/AAA domain